MSLDIYFREDIQDRLDSLCQANERLLTLVEGTGASPRDIALVRAAIRGTLADVAVSFGLHRQSPDFLAILEGAQFPVMMAEIRDIASIDPVR